MGNEIRILRFVWRTNQVDIMVEVDKCNIMDVIIEYEDKAKKQGLKLDYHYPTFSYVYNMEHRKLVSDKDLLLMFERRTDKLISIWVGTSLKPDPLYKLVLNLRRMNEKPSTEVQDDLPSLDDFVDTSVQHGPPNDGLVEPTQIQTKKTTKGKKPKLIPKTKSKATTTNLPPPPVSPKTAFERLPIRKSPRFSPSLTEKSFINPTSSLPERELFARKIPKTTARRKGLSTRQNVSTGTEQATGLEDTTMVCESSKNVKRKVEFDDEILEDKENWSFFFWNLYNTLKESERKDWTIISDRQKGIDLALADVWHYLKVKGIRRVCMVRIATRYENAMNWNDDELCPKIMKLVKLIGKDTISCKAYMSSPGEYEIHEGKSQFPLSLNNKICSCGAWQISGIPCRHAIGAMLHAKIDPQKVVSSWYHVRTYKQTYCFNISPIPDKNQWPTYDDLPSIMPPTMKRGVGRPCTNRRREEGEDPKGKRARTVKCKKCECYGHNARTCKGGLTGKQIKERKETGVPIVTRNPRVRDQSNAAKEGRGASKEGRATKKTSAGVAESQASINVTQGPETQSQQQQHI